MDFIKEYIIFLQEDNKKIVEAIRKAKENCKDNGYLDYLRKQLKKNNDELLNIAFVNKMNANQKQVYKIGGVR